MADPLAIDEDIHRARTLPAEVYRDPAWLDRQRERIFARSWQLVGDAQSIRRPGDVLPLMLLEGCLDEPVVLTRDADDRLHCLSNVCTHRGNLVALAPAQGSTMRCRYHGRRFGLDGKCQHMPEFEGVVGFPGPDDDLKRLEHGRYGDFLFASLAPAFPLLDWVAPVEARLRGLELGTLRFDAATSRDYLVRANWALYCDNYLEGFHIPFVHPALAGALDYGAYKTELHPYGSVQIGIAAGAEEAFAPPAGSPEHGQRVAAYYFWLFPNLMLNVYPWGISANVIVPLGPDRTRVRFLSYVGDPRRREGSAGAALDRVEREDEAVVEQVQLGVRSRLYHRGRYSPSRETGVHHFHRLMARFLNER